MRMRQIVETYPHARLSMLQPLMAGLGLTATSLLDFYDGTWVTITADTVMQVNTEYNVLLRLRPSLREPLEDCLGLEDMVSSQLPQRTSKRPGTTLVSPPTKIRRTQDASSASASSHARAETQTMPSSSDGSHRSSPVLEITSPRPVRSLPRGKPFPLDAHGDRASTPSIVGSQRSDWPSQFTVDAIIKGFAEMNQMADKGWTEKTAFPKVFKREYKKATVTSTKKVLRQASERIRKKYASTKWSTFAHAVKKGDSDSSDDFDSFIDTAPSVQAPVSSPLMRPPTASFSPKLGMHASNTSQPQLKQVSPVVSSLELSQDGPDGLNCSPSVSLDLSEFFPHLTGDPLCDFCDDPIPSNPSDKLRQMYAALKRKSRPQPTVNNPNHRVTRSWTVHFHYCQQHELESTLIPQAEASAWPLKPDFARLHLRVSQLWKTTLQEVLLSDLQENYFFRESAKRYEAQGSSTLAAESAGSQYSAYSGQNAG